MSLLPDHLRTPAPPRVYERAVANGRRQQISTPVAMDRSAALKVAWWRGWVVPEPSQPCEDFVALFLHLRGAAVARTDGVRERATPGAAILPGWLAPESWESEGVFEWCQFYISRALFDEVAGERFEGVAAFGTPPRSVARASGVSRLAWQARNELFAEAPSALQLDAWAILLSDAWLQDHAGLPADRAGVPKGALRSRAVARAIEFTEANLHRTVSLEEMARAAELSRFHLVRLFREFVGQTPAAYARARRIERSQQLLRSSDLPISEIALACGFADQSHFTAAFVRATGVTPGAYRQGR